jgi:hypothetical protein
MWIASGLPILRHHCEQSPENLNPVLSEPYLHRYNSPPQRCFAKWPRLNRIVCYKRVSTGRPLIMRALPSSGQLAAIQTTSRPFDLYQAQFWTADALVSNRQAKSADCLGVLGRARPGNEGTITLPRPKVLPAPL